ncbi:carboxypeptidase-like regulatory domain-containing protein [Elizabethkingia anophelis]|uniref:carboxypeptidase-like regulatory domain-containing protein n=1 Tax=Elizabethkingia anophelis TaxID=1117645 RepID=UPI0023505459|nr:carboxypeptidase-like regulatory domain-containing protein [Elizabethkingia anophelis]MDC8025747.1 carboxypeptidase-like regulatory domain-containing protein [Elizabethkingia anophelis]
MRKKLYVLSLLPICVQMAYAQQKAQLSGTLVDEKSKTPIIGAVVSLEKSKQRTTTGSDGGFVFVNLDAGEDQLVVNSAGIRPYRTTITINTGESKKLPVISLVQENQIDVQSILGVINDDVLRDDEDVNGQDIRSTVIMSMIFT